jgi:predicted acyl esterase
VMGGGDAHKTPEGRLFVGGAWRDEREWPLQRAVETAYYLHADGLLSTDKPNNAPPTVYQFDPRHPLPTIGGNVSSEGVLMLRGAQDQRCRPDIWQCEDTLPFSARSDVLRLSNAAARTRCGSHGPSDRQAVGGVRRTRHRFHSQAD